MQTPVRFWDFFFVEFPDHFGIKRSFALALSAGAAHARIVVRDEDCASVSNSLSEKNKNTLLAFLRGRARGGSHSCLLLVQVLYSRQVGLVIISCATACIV